MLDNRLIGVYLRVVITIRFYKITFVSWLVASATYFSFLMTDFEIINYTNVKYYWDLALTSIVLDAV
jgi:hypothetical protein